ncbi:MAG: TnsD family Tn7-like transposition protein [Cellulosilyticaceae bacterium]
MKNIEEQRAKWTQVVQDNPNCNRSQLKRIGGAAYTWIVKYDREWYETVTPKNKAHKERIDVIRHVHRDEELLKRAEMAVHMLSDTQQKTIRVTESAIKREVGITLKLNASEFEKTYKYTQEHIESLEKFRIRKIQWAIREILKEEQEISAYKIECKAGFGGKHLQEVRPLVEEILRQYS